MAWELTGNAGTDPATNFLGTTDNEPLIIKTNGTESLRVNAGGSVNFAGAVGIAGDLGIGPTNSHLYVYGPLATPNVETTELLRLTRQAVGGVKNGNSAGLFLGAFEPGINGRSRLDINVSGTPGDSNGWGGIPDVTVMTLQGNGSVGIGTTSPNCKLTVIGTETTPSGGGAAIQLTNSASGGTDWYLRVGATGTDTPVGGFSIANDERYCLTITRDGTVSTRDGSLSVGGNVTVGGDVILTGADCAEEFDIAEAVDIEPGTVMVLDQDGALHQSHQAYDKRVAGVISGAGDYRPGVILDRQHTRDNRLPIALVGKVYCKADAQYAPIEVGDLLTTSPTAGHAMKADDPVKAFGSVIGKALCPLETGQGLVPILIALQ